MISWRAIEAQLKAIRWQVAVLEGWRFDDPATRRRRAQALADLAERLLVLFAQSGPRCFLCGGDGVLMPSTRDSQHPLKAGQCPNCGTPAPGNTKERADADEQAHAEAMRNAAGLHGQG